MVGMALFASGAATAVSAAFSGATKITHYLPSLHTAPKQLPSSRG
jgi:hypothetical protein